MVGWRGFVGTRITIDFVIFDSFFAIGFDSIVDRTSIEERLKAHTLLARSIKSVHHLLLLLISSRRKQIRIVLSAQIARRELSLKRLVFRCCTCISRTSYRYMETNRWRHSTDINEACYLGRKWHSAVISETKNFKNLKQNTTDDWCARQETLLKRMDTNLADVGWSITNVQRPSVVVLLVVTHTHTPYEFSRQWWRFVLSSCSCLFLNCPWQHDASLSRPS
jgi:hypothetical protein